MLRLLPEEQLWDVPQRRGKLLALLWLRVVCVLQRYLNRPVAALSAS